MRKLGFESLSRSSRFRPPPERQWFMSVDRSTGVRRAARDTRSEVVRMLDEGVPRAEICSRLGVSPATVSYHSRRRDEPGSPACGRRYDWSAIQLYYDAG